LLVHRGPCQLREYRKGGEESLPRPKNNKISEQRSLQREKEGLNESKEM